MKLAFLSVLIVGALLGQVSAGSFYGQVLDPSGALVAGVHIKVTQETTGFVRETITDQTGAYRVPELEPGIYSVTTERNGFRNAASSHISLEINQTSRLDFQIELGTTQDSVTVAAAASRLQTDESSEGYHLTSPLFTSLPVDGRNIVSLVTVGPGAIPRQLGGFGHDGDNDEQEGSRGSVALNAPINGARPYMNSYWVDGAYNTDRNTFSAVVIPPMDSVQDFQVLTSLANPAFSQAGGGVIDIATKSGSQTFHGSGFEFVRNEATDAHNYFDDPTLTRPIFRRNQFGASLGGPLGLPSTFFFVSYEGLRSRSASSSVQLVPDATVRSGNFQGGKTIYNPLSLDGAGNRAPFANNVIPTTQIDPIAAKYLSQYEPLPNSSQGAGGNYLDATPSTTNYDSVSGRIDHQFQNAGLLFGRYTLNNEPGDFAGSFPLRATTEKLRAQQVFLGHTFTAGNRINEFRTSFTRLLLLDTPASAFKTNEAAALGIDNTPTDPSAFGLPYFFVTDFSTVTDSPTLPQTQRDNTFDVSEAFTVLKGHHTWTIGAEWNHFQLNYEQSNLIRGKYTYTGAYTANSLGAGGDGLADFLLGYPLTTERSVGTPLAYLRQTNYAAFVRHDWQVSSRLSLDLGVRYEYASPYSETRNKLLNLDYSTLPEDPKLINVSTATKPDYLTFSPRVGLAWRLPEFLSHGGETVFRAGYGIYFSPEIANEAYALVTNGIQTQINETSGLGIPTLTTRDGFTSTPTTGLPSYYGVDKNARTPSVQEWNASLQRELPSHIVFETAYVASKGTHLGLFRRFNTPLHTETGEDLNPRPGDLQALRAFPDLGTIFQRQNIANSSYQSLQIKAEKRLRNDLTFLASYVWSKSIDDADSVLTGFYDSAGAQNENNLRLERGLSFANVPRRFSAVVVYNVPAMPVLRPILSHWNLSGVITLQDGTPLNPFYIATDFANTGTPNRPNVVPGQSVSLPSSQRSVDHWFNTNAFSDPAPFTFGNAGRDIIPGPGNEVIDVSLARSFSIKERAKLQFRVEAFNLFNHPNYGIPGPYPDLGPFFARILSTGAPRRLEFGTRFDF